MIDVIISVLGLMGVLLVAVAILWIFASIISLLFHAGAYLLGNPEAAAKVTAYVILLGALGFMLMCVAIFFHM